MNFWIIAVCTMKRLFKDTKTMVTKIFLPIILMTIFGTVLASGFEAKNLEPCSVGYINLDQGSYSADLIKTLSEEDSIRDLITFVEVDSLAAAEKMCMNDELVAAIVFPANFSEKATDAKSKVSISIYTSKYSSASEMIVKNVIESCANVTNIVSALNSIEKWSDASEYAFGRGVDSIRVASPSSNRKVVSSMDYYAVTMLVFTLFYGIQYGIDCIAEDYIGPMGQRLRSTPVNQFSQFGGKILGSCIMNFLQGLVLMVVATLGFSVAWGGNLIVILFAALTFSVLATTVGALLCMLFKDANKASSFGALLVPVLTFISGGFTRLDFKILSSLSPNYLAQTAIFNAMYGADALSAWRYIGIMWGIIALLGFVTLAAGRHEQ